MPKPRNSINEKQIQRERRMTVTKRDDMIQKARFTLSVEEQRSVLYVISKINPTDTEMTEYSFDIKDFYAVCGLNNESYTKLKQTLIGLKSKCWWITLPDGETESAVSWFNVVRTNKKSGKVTIKLHEDMMPYLIDLKKQAESGAYFTDYELQYVLPMKSQYGSRLYELLKSYQKNNKQWYFEVEELKKKLNCATSGYKNFADFNKRALVKAIEDINAYSDIIISMETQKTGRKVTHVTFYMDGKTSEEIITTEKTIKEELDGQMDFDELRKEYSNSAESQFLKERIEAHKPK